MALTNAHRRMYIDRIIDIKTEVEELQTEKHELAKKLGYGTHRSRSFPRIKVVVSPGSGGWSISWKGIVEKLAAQYQLDIEKLKVGFRTVTHRSPSVSVQEDKAKRANPQLEIV